LREDYLTIQANVQETMRQLRTTGLLEKKSEVDQRRATIGNEKEKLTSHIAELNRRIDATTKTILREKQSLEQQIRQVTGEEIEISIDQT
jgi:signal transduction histidine kinase